MAEKWYKCLTPERTGGYSDFVWPEEGVDLPPIEGKLEMCKNGYHTCKLKNVLRWDKGGDMYEFIPDGDALHGHEKSCFRGGMLGRKLQWADRERRLFACDCAERVLHIFEAKYPEDDGPRKCLEVARRYANGEATEDEFADARAAAEAAARAAAETAARATARAVARAASDAAEAAARAAARDASAATRVAEVEWQTERLRQYLYGEVE